MNDLNKKDFWVMLNVTMELTNHPPLSKEAVIIWYNQLKQFEFSDVSNAIDSWLKVSSKPPTPKDIIDACKPKQQDFKALPRPKMSEEKVNQIHEKLSQFTSPKRDMKSWAKKIIDNPSMYPDISLRFAKEALGVTE